jgi:hypothetical protein
VEVIADDVKRQLSGKLQFVKNRKPVESGWSKIPEASIPVSILSVSESELVSADRIDT